MSSKQKWFPLESNPELMNEYIGKMGFNTHSFHFMDVFGTEEWALEMIPQPVAAVIMLYPLTEKQLGYEEQEKAPEETPEKVWFIKQRIGNACGTIGLLHALLNAPEMVQQTSIQQGSWLHDFQVSCPTSMDPIKKAEILEGDPKIRTLHEAATSSEHNQTRRPDIDEEVVTHFVSFVEINSVLYECDGRKQSPIPHGTCTNLLTDACRVIREFMTRDPDEVRFTILAFAPHQDE